MPDIVLSTGDTATDKPVLVWSLLPGTYILVAELDKQADMEYVRCSLRGQQDRVCDWGVRGGLSEEVMFRSKI